MPDTPARLTDEQLDAIRVSDLFNSDTERLLSHIAALTAERDAAQRANDDLAKMLAREVEHVATEKTLRECAANMSKGVWADHERQFAALVVQHEARERELWTVIEALERYWHVSNSSGNATVTTIDRLAANAVERARALRKDVTDER